MTQTLVNHNASPNPDPQKAGGSEDHITYPQDQQTLPDRLPKSLVEWLARINQRYLALNQEKTNDSKTTSP